MPQRTNDFQRLVKLIHQALSESGAKIQESVMVHVPTLGEFREIDVLVETPASPYTIKIAVEAKDHHRKLNVIEIEAIIGKFRGEGSVQVDKVVIVSRNGCSRQAAKKAALAGIELREISETKESSWRALLPFAPGQQLVIPQLPWITDVRPDPPLPPGIFSPKTGMIVNKETGREIDPPMRYVVTVLRQCRWLDHPGLATIVTVAKRERSSIELSYPMEKFV